MSGPSPVPYVEFDWENDVRPISGTPNPRSPLPVDAPPGVDAIPPSALIFMHDAPVDDSAPLSSSDVALGDATALEGGGSKSARAGDAIGGAGGALASGGALAVGVLVALKLALGLCPIRSRCGVDAKSCPGP